MGLQNTKQNKTVDKKVSQSESPLVQVKRTFRAPVEQVWKAWSDAEFIKQWWGPKGYTAPSAKIDFRVGGKYLCAMQAPDGKVIWSGGVYKEIILNKKIVCTDHFSDKDGNAISAKEVGMTGEWPKDLYVTVEFESVKADQTKMSLQHKGIPPEMHDECVEGWGSSIDKLQKFVERKK